MPGENGTKAALWLSYFNGRTSVIDFDTWRFSFIVVWLSIVSRPTWLKTSPSAGVLVFILALCMGGGGGGVSVVLLLRPMCMACIGGVGAFSVVLLRPMCMVCRVWRSLSCCCARCVWPVGGAFSVVLLRPMWLTTSVFAASSAFKNEHFVVRPLSDKGWVQGIYFPLNLRNSLWLHQNDMVQKKASVYHWSLLVVNIFTCLYFIVLSLEILRLTNLTMEKIRILFEEKLRSIIIDILKYNTYIL